MTCLVTKKFCEKLSFNSAELFFRTVRTFLKLRGNLLNLAHFRKRLS